MRVGRPFESFIGPLTPLIRAQKDLRRLAAFDPRFTLPVTGALRLDPVLALKYRRPAAVKPPVLLLCSLRTTSLSYTESRIFLVVLELFSFVLFCLQSVPF